MYLPLEIMGWNGFKNGELLKLMINEGFDALLTFDKNLQHQQNFTKYPITVFILSAPINSYIEMSKLSVIVHEHLKKSELRKGVIIIKNSAGV